MKKYFSVLSLILLLSVFANAQKKSKMEVKHLPIDTSKFVLVEGGIFTMGTDQPVEQHEGPPHQVTLKSFYMAKTEATFEDYDKYTKDRGKDTVTSGAWGRGKQPVFMVTWNDAVEYCNWLSEKEKLSKCYVIKGNEVQYLDTAKGYRLPTEAEWEFAARGGNKSKGTLFAGGSDLNSVAWFKDNCQGRSHAVAQKAANELGLYDMTGNLWEWVWDIYDWNYYKSSPPTDPLGPATGPYRVMRGGAWYNDSKYSRIVTRQDNPAGFRQNSVGFRVARSYY